MTCPPASPPTISATVSTVSASSPVTTGVSSTITITIRNSAGTPVAGVTPTFTASGSNNTLTQPGASNASGICTGSISSTTAESKTITVMAMGLELQDHPVIVVQSAAIATQVNFVIQPSNVVAGQAIPTFTVAVQDATGATVTNSTALVFVGVNSGPAGCFLAGTTSVNAVAGIATFSNVSCSHHPGTWSMLVGASGLIANASSTFTVSSALAQITITTQPAGAVDNVALTTQPALQARNAAGQTIAQSGITITAAILSGAGSIIGTTTASTNATGLATWSTLGVNATTPPSNFTLRFSVSGLTVDSASFSVSAPPSGSWPNDPGGTLVTNYGFDEVIPDNGSPTDFGGFGSAGWSVYNRRGANGTNSFIERVTDATGPHSPSFVVQFNYALGFTGNGSDPGTLYRPIGGGTELYIGFWWKASSPWQSHPTGVNKILFQEFSSGADQIAMVWQNANRIRLVTEMSTDARPLEPNQTQTTINTNTWYQIEWRMHRGTGLTRWWVNNILQGSFTVNYPSGSFSQIQVAPGWGGSGGSKSVAGGAGPNGDWMRYDHIRIVRI